MPTLAELTNLNKSLELPDFGEAGMKAYNNAAGAGLEQQKTRQEIANIKQTAEKGQLENALTKGKMIYSAALGASDENGWAQGKQFSIDNKIMTPEQADATWGTKYTEDFQKTHLPFLSHTLAGVQFDKTLAETGDAQISNRTKNLALKQSQLGAAAILSQNATDENWPQKRELIKSITSTPDSPGLDLGDNKEVAKNLGFYLQPFLKANAEMIKNYGEGLHQLRRAGVHLQDMPTLSNPQIQGNDSPQPMAPTQSISPIEPVTSAPIQPVQIQGQPNYDMSNSLTGIMSDGSQPPAGAGVANTMPSTLPSNQGAPRQDFKGYLVDKLDFSQPIKGLNEDSPALLKLRLDPQEMTYARKYATGQGELPKAKEIVGGEAAVSDIRDAANILNPNLDPNNFERTQKAIDNAKKTYEGSSPQVVAMQKGASAVQHLQALNEIGRLINNGGSPARVNAFINKLGQELNHPNVTTYESIKPLVVDEIESAYKSGGGTAPEREEMMKNLGLNLSNEARESNIKGLTGLLHTQLATIDKTRVSAYQGMKEAWDNLPEGTREIFNNYGMHSYTPSQIKALKAAQRR